MGFRYPSPVVPEVFLPIHPLSMCQNVILPFQYCLTQKRQSKYKAIEDCRLCPWLLQQMMVNRLPNTRFCICLGMASVISLIDTHYLKN